MKIDREKALSAFRDYVSSYDCNNISVALKIAHTYRVAEISERIARTIPEIKFGTDFAWLLGLLHDIGRFEQVTRYGTFKDALSVDHAELGADILFRDGLIDQFISGSDEMKNIAENAIRLHNKFKIPNNLDIQAELYSKILRDADKVDIFRVMTEPPYFEIFSDLNDFSVRDEVIQSVREHRCVERPKGKEEIQANPLETLIGQCCMAFELEFPESRRIVSEQGYLKKTLEKAKTSKYVAELKAELDKYM